MAVDSRRADDNKRRPSSAPKTSEMTNIPKIVLEDKDRADQDIYVVSRSQTEMGIPAASMPNLVLDRLGENSSDGGSDSNLGVFCSPRMTRRSVDLDVNNRDPNRKDMEWFEGYDQSNSLRVLSSSSRVGSAVSLNSECTARSIGLISNDSSSDSTSVSEKPNETSEKVSHLRRLQSYPEDRETPETNVTRTSQSCANLKSVQKPSLDNVEGISETNLCLLPSESIDNYSDDIGTDKSAEESFDEKTRQRMVCYKRGPKSYRDGRIRKWLQDMDKNEQTEVNE